MCEFHSEMRSKQMKVQVELKQSMQEPEERNTSTKLLILAKKIAVSGGWEDGKMSIQRTQCQCLLLLLVVSESRRLGP
jgi:hypothetical protein